MSEPLWEDCAPLSLKSSTWPFGSMATKHKVDGWCQVGGSLDQRHLTRGGSRALRTAARSIGMGLFFSDPSGSLRRWLPYSSLHGKDVQKEEEAENLFAHASTATPRWHEYGQQALLPGRSKKIYRELYIQLYVYIILYSYKCVSY